jgi:hypothetical protein
LASIRPLKHAQSACLDHLELLIAVPSGATDQQLRVEQLA